MHFRKIGDLPPSSQESFTPVGGNQPSTATSFVFTQQNSFVPVGQTHTATEMRPRNKVSMTTTSFVPVGGAKKDAWKDFYGDGLTEEISRSSSSSSSSSMYSREVPHITYSYIPDESLIIRSQNELVDTICKLAACWLCCGDCGFGRPLLGIMAVVVGAFALKTGNLPVAAVAYGVFLWAAFSRNS